MLRTELKEDGVAEVLGRLAASLTDLRPVMTEIGEAAVETTEQRFRQGVDPEGRPWAPKSPATLAAYARRGKTAPRPLWGPGDDVHLAESIFYEAGSDWTEIGTNKIQSAVMQYGAAKGAFGATKRGSQIPWGDIPARPYLGISEADRTNIAEIVEEWLERVAAGGR